jgi:hypothetical protein
LPCFTEHAGSAILPASSCGLAQISLLDNFDLLLSRMFC